METPVYLGRFSPIHLGHQKIIDKLITKYGIKNIILMVGSTNLTNERTPYSYNKRRKLIHTIYPDLKVIPVPDFNNDKLWLNYLKRLEKKLNKKFLFVGGSKEDLEILNLKFPTKVLVRRITQGKNISATKIRELLKYNDELHLQKMVDKRVLAFLLKKNNN